MPHNKTNALVSIKKISPKKSREFVKLQIELNLNHLLTNLEGSICAWLFVNMFGCQVGNSSDVTLAFEDAQVIQTFLWGGD